MEVLGNAPKPVPADAPLAKDMASVFYDGLPWRKKPTRVFAYYGLPKVAPGAKVPGMVLVHGGGGSAFDAWVRLWNSRGYAAIAMDTCGCVPIGSYGKWQRHNAGGPPGWGGLDQIDEPAEDHWTYHAIADVGPGPFALAVPARGRSGADRGDRDLLGRLLDVHRLGR